MDVRSVKQIIAEGENSVIEFTNCTTEITDSVFQVICSFLNKDGGTLVIGVHDFGKIIGVADMYIDSMLNRIEYTLLKEFSPAVSINPEVLDVEGKKIIYLSIPQAPDVQRYRNKVYDRSGREVNDVTYNYNLVENIYLRKKKESSENIVCPFLRMHDFDERAFNTMRRYVAMANPVHPWLSFSDEEFLHAAGFWRKDPLSNKEGVVLAAVLLFGKEVTIQNCCPVTHRTDAIYRNVSYNDYLQPSSNYPENRYDDRDIVYSNLIDSYLRLMTFMERNLPERTLELDGKLVDVRKAIFNELLTNMLVHRDYTQKYPARLLIFSDMVITENATRILEESKVKNPLITKVFQAMNWAGEPGSGRKNIQKYAPLYDRTFDIEMQDAEKYVFSISYGNAEGLDYFQTDVKPELNGSVKANKQSDNQPEFPVYFSKLSQACPTIDISYVDKAESVLEACVKPLPIQDMMRMVKQSNRTRFRQNILRPLLDEGLLAMRIPTKPSSPLQTYFTTEKGKALLYTD
ncbi:MULTISPECIES: RNA-binding domain-containing protein [unclassified Parabacteroides]|nr:MULTISPECIES: RNA-binding domain-containing protein [unclassified Parabacteroides]